MPGPRLRGGDNTLIFTNATDTTKREGYHILKIYLVGGAVRDAILGLPIEEKDWVVVGSRPEEMLAQGFLPVGKEFPVFLHPKTKDEYALARTERKTAKGYKGFVFHADPSVTLEEDLARRDLTVNAIAQDDQGNLIDPFGGTQDLKNKIFRHVSAAFSEDPVRILRLARFAARFNDFTVDPSTNKLMQDMVQNGEVDALVPERVWQEFEKALGYADPSRFFAILNDCGALEKLFPELMEIQSYELPAEKTVRFAILLNHLSLNQIEHLCNRYRVPNDYSDLAKLTVKLKENYLALSDAKSILNFILSADALRRKARFDDLLTVYKIALKNTAEKNALLEKALIAIKNIDIKTLQERGLKGQEFADALYELRLEALGNLN